MKHLAIFDDLSVKKILDGRKTLDLRLSLNRIPPYRRVTVGDKVLIKKSGGQVVGQFKAESVVTYDHLTPAQLDKLHRDFKKEIAMEDYFWAEHAHARFATLIYISQVQPSLIPLTFKKKDRRAWVVLK